MVQGNGEVSYSGDTPLTLDNEFFDEYFQEIFATVPQPELATDILGSHGVFRGTG